MSRAGSQWWPPDESEDEEGQPSGPAGGRRPNPILTADQRRPAPDVAAVLAKTARLGNGSSGTRKTTVELPLDLWAEMRSLARELSNHGRRGYSAFIAACLRYAVDAYKRGEWEVVRKPKVAYYDLEIARRE